MAELLSGPQADRLKEILNELGEIQSRWARSSGPWHVSTATRSRLERLQREVDKKFHYSKIKTVLVQSGAPTAKKQ